MKTLKFALLCAIFSTLVSVASAQESKKENSATKPAPRDKGWEKRHETFVGIAKRGNVDLLFLGDSITDAWGGEGHGMGGGHKISYESCKLWYWWRSNPTCYLAFAKW
jgi:beta-glucosidase